MRLAIRSKPRTRAMLALAGGLLLLASSVPGGAAATRTSITIDVNPDAGTELFTTTGGALCPNGSASTDFRMQGGSWRAGTFHLSKLLVCDDGSGTFTIDVNAATVFGSPTDQGGWSAIGGTGDYAGLHGGGNLVGTYVDTGIIDQYTGVVTR